MKSAIDFLIEWAENLNWKNHLLNTVLQNQNIDIEAITKEIIEIFTNNKTVNIITCSSHESDQIRLYIKEIKTPVNINALCSEANCKLGKNLNVFYGENGSGKSSYVKVFRKLADNYYTTEKNLDILPNIYTTNGSSDNQTITVCYSCDDITSCAECINLNVKHNDLSKINVFDSNSITPLLNTDLTFSVLPQGFKYFTQITDLMDSIKSKLQDMINEYRIKQSKIFEDSSFSLISEDILAITSTMQTANLERSLRMKYPLPDKVDIQIDDLDRKIKELQDTNSVALIKILNIQKTKLESIKNSFNILSIYNALNNEKNQIQKRSMVLSGVRLISFMKANTAVAISSTDLKKTL